MQRKNTAPVIWLLVFLLTAGFSPAINAAGKSGAAPTSQAEQSIKVHGHWIIEVRNPDGSLVRRWEFENDLTSDGPNILSSILVRTHVSGGWFIVLGAPGGSQPCGTDAAPSQCFIHEESLTAPSPNFFNNLTLGRGADGKKIVLTGSATARRNGSIPRVGSWLQFCQAHLPCLGTSASFTPFTSKDLSPAISVLSGQQIQVTVEIGFS